MIFAMLRIFDVARVIQMNMEISLVLAHGCLLLPSMPDAIEVNLHSRKVVYCYDLEHRLKP